LSGKWTGGVVPLGYTTKGKLVHRFLKKGMKDDEALREANKIAPEKGRLYLVKHEAELIRKIYQLYLERRSLRRVTYELNEKGIKTPEGETWATSSIRRILTNPTYIGMVWYGKRKTELATGKLKNVKQELWKVVKGEHEAVIPEELFEKVQSLLKQKYMKPSKAKGIYLLTSLLRCGLCKGGMFGYLYFKKKYDKEYFYYRCRNCVQKGRVVCKGMVVPAGVVEKAVIDTLLELSKNEKFLHQKEKLLDKLKQRAKPVKSEFEDGKKRLVQEEKRLVDVRTTLLEKLENKIIDDAVFVERFDENKKQIDIVRNRIAELASKGKEINLQEIAMQTSYEDLCNLLRYGRILQMRRNRKN
jgi:site-specific DNA recombinase